MRDRGLRACLALLLALTLSSAGLLTPRIGPLGLEVRETAAANAVVSTCDWASFSAALATVQSTGGGTLVFDCAGTINFASTISIITNVRISGQGVVFDGGSPFFTVPFGRTLTLIDLTLQNGSRSGTGTINGGAIFSQGTLNIIGVTFDNNQIQSTGNWAQGAAIYATGPTTIVGSTFTNNAGMGDVVRGAAIASFSSLTIVSSLFQDNAAIGDASGPQTGSLGGAIYSSGSINIRASSFIDNSATDPATGEGGAIFLSGGGPHTIVASTFDGNSALGGGAIFMNGASLDIESSTFVGNTSTFSGGAITSLGFGLNILNISASTFSANNAGGSGGAIYNFQNSNITILGSTFAGNTAATSGSTFFLHLGGTNMSFGGTIIDSTGLSTSATCTDSSPSGAFSSLDYNISSSTTCNLIAANDQPGTNPLLDATLADNGGPTETHLLQSGSPAQDDIPAGSCATVSTSEDQRGVARPFNVSCDIGAVEMGGIPPVQIHAVWNDSPILLGHNAEVSVTASGPPAIPLAYEFDCNGNGAYGDAGDVGPQAATGAPCLFSSGGSKTVNVRVTAGGDQVTDSTTVTVLGPTTPVVNTPTFSPPVPDEGTPVTASATFTIESAGSTITCTVDYGEGDGPQSGTVMGSTCTGPNHTYDDNATYTVTVEICNDALCGDSNAMLEVGNANPVVGSVSTLPATLDETQSTTVSATFSDAGPLDTHTCSIDWGDGSITAGTVDQNADTCTGTHQYLDDDPSGTSSDDYTITVTITDDDSGFDANSTNVTVNNVAPTLTSVTNDGPVDEGSPATITVNGANDVAGPAEDPLSYEFDCGNDGTFEIGPQASSSADCTFANDGAYVVAARVSDDDLGSATDTTTVTVNNVAPAITSVDLSPDAIDDTQMTTVTVEFTDPGSADTHTCTIDWGDGSAPEAGTVDQGADTCTATHTYADDNPAGTPSDLYSVQATISDGLDQDVESAQITVNNVAPVINSITTDGPAAQGQPVNVTVLASDVAGANDPLTYEFDCDNDGSYEIPTQPSNTATCTLASGAASSTIGVRVTDDDTGVVTGEVSVSQSVGLCVAMQTRVLYGQMPDGSCAGGQVALSLPGAQSLNICSDPRTGQLTYAGTTACPATWRTHVVPDGGPVDYCRSVWTGKLRYVRPTLSCGGYEIRGVIPGE